MQIQWPDGIDTDVFLQEFWQRKPLLIKNAFAGFDNPLDENELAGLALDEDANARFIECVNGHEWRLSHGPFDEAFFESLQGNQWSLLVSDIEKLLPEFRTYLEPFRFLPDWRIDDLMISYAPVGGSVGAHIDQYDVFLLQAAGTREWQYENNARTPTQHQRESAIALLSDFCADEVHHLDVGDMLYIPPQFAHHGIAAEEPCMTWSIGFRAPSVDEMLPSVVNYLLEETGQQERFTDTGRAPVKNAGEVTERDFQELRELIHSAMRADTDTLDRCIGRYLSETATAEAVTTANISVQQLFADKPHVLSCNSTHSLAYKANGANALLFANGECITLSLELAESLCQSRIINTAEVKPLDRDAVTTLVNLQTLIENEQH